MEDSSNPTTTDVSVSTPAPAATPAQEEAKVQMSSRALEQRLAQERDRGQRVLLKELGIEQGDRDAVMEKIKAGQLALAQRDKLEAEAKQQVEDLRKKADRADKLEPIFRSFVDEQMKALPESVQKFIASTAGDSAEARYQALQTAKEAGLFTLAPAAAPAPVPAAEVKPVKPATTMAAEPTTAPKVSGEKSHFETWQDLKSAGHNILAANYYHAHSYKIEAQRK